MHVVTYVFTIFPELRDGSNSKNAIYCEEVQEMIAKAKEGGMKFYGLAVNLYNPRSMGIMEAMNICDSKWQWEGGECVEITEGEIDREKN